MIKQRTIQNVEAYLKENGSPSLLRTHKGLGTERKVIDVYEPRKKEVLVVTFSDGVQTNVPSNLIATL